MEREPGRRGASPRATSEPAPFHPGVFTTLGDLIDMRHRVREVPLFSTPQRRSPLVGLHHSKLRGRGVDFDQVRVYQAGDDVRTIDWRVTARSQEPHTKLFHEERERPIYLIVEQSRRLFFGSGDTLKSVLAARAAALVGWAALAHNDRVGGLVFGEHGQDEVRPRRNKHSLLILLDRLVRANRRLIEERPVHPESLAQALRRAREVLRPGSLAVLFCDERALTDTATQQLHLLGRHIDLLLMPLSDPLDHALPAAGLLRFASGTARLELDSHDAGLRQAYRAEAASRRERWQQLANKLCVPLLPLDTQSDPVDQLRAHLGIGRTSRP